MRSASGEQPAFEPAAPPSPALSGAPACSFAAPVPSPATLLAPEEPPFELVPADEDPLVPLVEAGRKSSSPLFSGVQLLAATSDTESSPSKPRERRKQ